MSEKIKKEIAKLVADLNYWNQQYFDYDQPVVSDQVYDTHLKKLVALEKQYPQYVLDQSPTKKIGATLTNKFAKVKHQKQMLSLDKAYSLNELAKFINDLKQKTNDQTIDFMIQPKIDGLSIALHYQDGKLIKALTRGDGQVGEDVSANVIGLIKSIPTTIDYLQPLEVRGEIYISKSMFAKINQSELTQYANPRNLASGTLRQLDRDIIKKRNLSAFIYDLVDYQNHQLKTQDQVWNFLKQLNFPILETIKQVNNLDQIKDFIDLVDQTRQDLDYEIDGLVLKLNQINYYQLIGYTTKFPKYAIAYKFADEVVDTILEDIFITIGRTGLVTYNAKLKPISLGGTIVSAATLHNYNYISDLNININDEVSIKKAGEIIPKVISLKQKRSTGVFAKITKCPSCHNLLVDTKTMNNQVCLYFDCPEIQIRKIIHFASRQAANIEGLAEGIVRRLYEANFLKNISDIFSLNQYQDQIINLDGFGPKFWNNLWTSIEATVKNISLEALIFGLGIAQLGIKGAKLIANQILQFDQLLNINYSDLELIKDIGPITIEGIKAYLANQENQNLINKLIAIGINPKVQAKLVDQDNFFANKTFVITGTLNQPRQQIIKQLEALGANVSNAISKNTFALIVGQNVGQTKITKAQNLNIKVINESELEQLLNQSNLK